MNLMLTVITFVLIIMIKQLFMEYLKKYNNRQILNNLSIIACAAGAYFLAEESRQSPLKGHHSIKVVVSLKDPFLHFLKHSPLITATKTV